MLLLCAAATGVDPAEAKPGNGHGKPAHAGHVTRGSFSNLAGGTSRGFHISGKAHMVRTGHGTTKVSVHIKGLTPGHTYAVHVHNQACSNGEGGGHYTFPAAVTGGAGPANNEIWPGPVTANGGGVGNGRTRVGARAGVTAVSVVVHDADTTKIGCADLA